MIKQQHKQIGNHYKGLIAKIIEKGRNSLAYAQSNNISKSMKEF
jgi:hypothetical protein